MYPHTEDATDERRQVDVDEHPSEEPQDAQQHDQYGETPAGEHDYGTAEAGFTGQAYGEPATGQDRTWEHGEPAADQEEADQEEYAEPSGHHDQLNGSAGNAEPELDRPGDDSREEPADETSAGDTAAQAPADAASAGADTGEQRAPQPTDSWQLFGTEDADNLRSRWAELQGSFVDDPKQAVQQAEQFVNEVVQTVTDRFNERKKDLQAHGSADTEQMRLAMIRYRGFFRQMLGG